MAMAKLVGVARDPEKPGTFRKRQLPMSIEENMRVMIAEFGDPCEAGEGVGEWAGVGGGGRGEGGVSMKAFCQKLSSLHPDELNYALTVEYEQFSVFLSQLVPCVGCRRCVEKLFVDLANSGHPTLDPLVISSSYTLTVERHLLGDYKRLYKLLFGDYPKLRSLTESLTKCRKNRRCQLHSLDVHACKMKSGWTWVDLFEILSSDCKTECCIVDSACLQSMLETYLEKHRFCPECKNKLQKAYSCLTGEVDGTKEKGYNNQLFRGLSYCEEEAHIHLNPCTKFLTSLIERAETELSGSSRERHAKTLEVGQMEVLTCIGLFMHNRLYKINTALKTLHISFQLLYATSLMALYANFQAVMESKEGLNESFEKLCRELQESTENPNPQKLAKSKKKKKHLTKSNSEKVVQENILKGVEVGKMGEGDKKDPGYSSSREGSPGNTSLSAHSLGCKGFTKGCHSCLSHAMRAQQDWKSTITDSPSLLSSSSSSSQNSLLFLLQEENPNEENGGISQKEIDWFKQNESMVSEQRKALRQRIWDKFHEYQANKRNEV